jgi:cob(I)alamin adenosyltransferase
MKIYTKTGDDGSTGVVSGRRVKKASSMIESYGTVDELNSFMGWCAVQALASDVLASHIDQIQNDLHVVAADLATPPDVQPKLGRTQASRVSRLEKWIDEFEQDLEPLRNFVLPGGSELASRLHIARTVARRCEREVLRLSEEQQVHSIVHVYLNRLSDYLFVAARWSNFKSKIPDRLWDQQK